MKAEIITVGDELLTGERTNTNGPWLGRYMANQSIEVRRIIALADHQQDLVQALQAAMNEMDLVIVTGGLGPTRDDITKKALQLLFQKPLTRHEPTLSHIKKLFKKRGIQLTESNVSQADVLSNSEVLFNEQGTAPGMWFQESGVGIAVLPGVPHEMKYLMRERVQPKIERLKSWKERQTVAIHYIQTAGIGESTLSDRVLSDLKEYETDQVICAFLPHPGGVTIRVNSYAENENKARQQAHPLIQYIRNRANDYIYNDGRERSLNEKVAELLIDQGLNIAVAESCTGGLLMNTLTDVSGSSHYFNGGIVAYSNRLKQKFLGVSDRILDQYGAVSKPVALQMARAAAGNYEADIGISTTGIAGPTGGTKQKPVGTVWVGYYSNDKHFALNTVLAKERDVNKQKSVAIAMDLIRRRVSGIDSLPYDLRPAYAHE